MKWLVLLLAFGAVAAIVGVIYVRTAGHDPERWHVDPAKVVDVQERNEFLGSQVFSEPPEVITVRLTGALGGDVLVGDFSDGFVTVVVRTALVGYPDYISARIDGTSEGTMVRLYSRSRFGHSDLGANKTRVIKVFNDMQAKF